ncbi:MAG: lipoprotein [Gammaproteobacteria bacterium]|nr:lipoprotein [Gammaproteobacteria bacterium]
MVISERIATVLLMMLLLLNTTGCGNKGALYIPDEKPVTQPFSTE